ncbi:MAG: trigger factor [Pseudomonadota bacterium]|nr:trigger factor [Pseudomonadota bacterium]
MSSLNIDGLKCTAQLDVSADVADKIRHQKIEELKKNVQVPGYRPNKVPNSYIIKRFGDKLDKDVLDEVVSKSFGELLSEHNVIPAEEPKETIDSKEIGKPIKIKFEFECLPQFKLLGKDDMQLDMPVVKVTDELVKKEIDELKLAFPLWSPSKEKAKNDDRIKITYTCQVDGEPFNNGEMMKADAVLGKETLYPELEKALVGLKSGDVKEIKLKFEDDYPNPSLAGKNAEFNVTVTEVEKSSPTKVDEAFIERALGQKKSEKEFNEVINSRIEKQIKDLLDGVMVDRLQDLLMDKYDFQLPETLFKNELEARASSKPDDEKEKLLKLTMSSKDKEVKDIIKALRLGLVAAQYSEENKLDITEKELADFIVAFASNSGKSEDFLRWFIEDERRVMDARNRLLHQKSVEHMIKAYSKEGKELTMSALEKLAKETQSKES